MPQKTAVFCGFLLIYEIVHIKPVAFFKIRWKAHNTQQIGAK